jgi:hypothetical protein
MIQVSRLPDGGVLQALIDTGNCFALLPVASFAPLTLDWDSIEYKPTRNAIKGAWDAWVLTESPDLSHESPNYFFRPRPDLVEVIPIAPDWQGFMDAIDLPPTGNGLFAQLLALDAISAWQAYNMSLAFVKGTAGSAELRALQFIYGQFMAVLPTELRTALQAAISSFNIPIAHNLQP